MVLDDYKAHAFEVSFADLQSYAATYVSDNQANYWGHWGKLCLSILHGMDLTFNNMPSKIKEWQAMIEAYIHVKTGHFNLFGGGVCICFYQETK